MSLDWQFYETDEAGKITGRKLGETDEGQARWQELTTDEEWPITERLIWATALTGVPSITEASAAELASRLAQLGFCHAEDYSSRWWNIPVEAVKARAGLRTNSRRISPAEWRRKIVEEVEAAGYRRLAAAESRSSEEAAR